MKRHENNLPLILGILGITFLVLLVMVSLNDRGSATEVALLEGTPVQATSAECDALYHAIWKVKQEPSHSTLIDIAVSLDCPFENE
jgi:hypothetical protein